MGNVYQNSTQITIAILYCAVPSLFNLIKSKGHKASSNSLPCLQMPCFISWVSEGGGAALAGGIHRSSGLHCKISAITFAAYTCVRVVSSSANFERHPCRPSAYRSLPRGNCRVHFSLLPCSIPHSFINNCSPCQHQSCASLHQRSQHSHNLTILDTRGVSELFSVFFPYGF